eukprot:bmy_01823T0
MKTIRHIGCFVFSIVKLLEDPTPYRFPDLLDLRCSQMGPCARPQYCQGTKPEGEDPQCHIRKPNARGQVQNWLSSGPGLVL